MGKEIHMGFVAKECDMRDWKSGVVETTGVVKTTGMNDVMESFGGFPAQYYVRNEVRMVFNIIWESWEKSSNDVQKFAIAGSPGVGKSAFMVYLAFFLTRHCTRNVLLLRKVKTGKQGYKCVLLCKDSYTEIKVSRLSEMVHIRTRLHDQYPGLLFFADGFTYVEVQQNHEDLSPYALLATSSQFTTKRDDPTQRILLPAWQFDALSDFAVKTKMFEKGETAKEVFYYSGGSLRDFCTNLEDLKITVEQDLALVAGSKQAIMLMGIYGAAHLDQVDRIRRTYVDNPEKPSAYKGTGTLFVDSRYVLQRLIQQIDVDQYEQLYKMSKVVGGALHGLAFEMYLHKLATGNGFKIQARAYNPPPTASGDHVEIRIRASNSTREGSNESECKDFLRHWCVDKNSQYWYPDYAMFPNLDSVAKPVQPCLIDLAYIQMTVSDTHKLNREWLEELHDGIFKSFTGKKAYIAILPEKTEKFKLTPPQKPTTVQIPTTVPLSVAYFDGMTVPLYVAYFDGALGPNPE
jgi:hypothetical protein